MIMGRRKVHFYFNNDMVRLTDEVTLKVQPREPKFEINYMNALNVHMPLPRMLVSHILCFANPVLKTQPQAR